LQPNKVYNPGHTVQLPVPKMKVCGYFLRTDKAEKKRETAVVVKRLQQAGVEGLSTRGGDLGEGLHGVRTQSGGDHSAGRHLLDSDGAG
jgi:hypothetical protein